MAQSSGPAGPYPGRRDINVVLDSGPSSPAPSWCVEPGGDLHARSVARPGERCGERVGVTFWPFSTFRRHCGSSYQNDARAASGGPRHSDPTRTRHLEGGKKPGSHCRVARLDPCQPPLLIGADGLEFQGRWSGVIDDHIVRLGRSGDHDSARPAPYWPSSRPRHRRRRTPRRRGHPDPDATQAPAARPPLLPSEEVPEAVGAEGAGGAGGAGRWRC